MNAEFNWWLLIVGLVVGAALTWLVMSESVRRDIDETEEEQRGEARWISSLVSGAGRQIPPARVQETLRLHREYLAAPPPDDPMEPGLEAEAPEAVAPVSVDPGPVRRVNEDL
jgi:hypothetical protein